METQGCPRSETFLSLRFHIKRKYAFYILFRVYSRWVKYIINVLNSLPPRKKAKQKWFLTHLQGDTPFLSPVVFPKVLILSQLVHHGSDQSRFYPWINTRHWKVGLD